VKEATVRRGRPIVWLSVFVQNLIHQRILQELDFRLYDFLVNWTASRRTCRDVRRRLD
jgi:hypothetical protein